MGSISRKSIFFWRNGNNFSWKRPTSLLLHLKDIFVQENNLIKKGQVIGLMGDTGRATGSHLDWRMEIRGVRIDPHLLIKKNN